MEAHLEQQESMFAESTEPELHESAEGSREPDSISEPQPALGEANEVLVAGAEGDDDSYSAVAAKPDEPETAEGGSAEAERAPESDGAADHESKHEPVAQQPVEVFDAKADDLTPLSADDFSALEVRVLRAVSVVRTERDARIAAEDRVAKLQAQLDLQTPLVERLQSEIELLRLEREQVRQRVERLLAQLDALEL